MTNTMTIRSCGQKQTTLLEQSFRPVLLCSKKKCLLLKPIFPAASTVAVTANVDGTIVSELQVALADAQALVMQHKDAMAAAEQRYLDMEARAPCCFHRSIGDNG